jgi:hypothetical protein
MLKKIFLLAAVLALIGAIPCFAVGPSFYPDGVFKGSSLKGWHTLGGADWRAEGGELIGIPKKAGGWLLLDQSYQDVGFYINFQCTGGCETGVLFRAEKIDGGGMKGIYASILTSGEKSSRV